MGSLKGSATNAGFAFPERPCRAVAAEEKFRRTVTRRGRTHTKVLFRHAGVQLSPRSARFIGNDAWKTERHSPRHPAVRFIVQVSRSLRAPGVYKPGAHTFAERSLATNRIPYLPLLTVSPFFLLRFSEPLAIAARCGAHSADGNWSG